MPGGNYSGGVSLYKTCNRKSGLWLPLLVAGLFRRYGRLNGALKDNVSVDQALWPFIFRSMALAPPGGVASGACDLWCGFRDQFFEKFYGGVVLRIANLFAA